MSVQKKYDVIIVGGGSAGIMAALAASEQVEKVLLVEKENALGGLATGARVGTICGIYKYDDSHDFIPNIGKSSLKFVEGIRSLSKADAQRDNTGLKYLPYEIETVDAYSQELLKKAGVDVVLETVVKNLEVIGDTFSRLELSVEGEHYWVEGKSVVDASGVSVISQILSHALIPCVFKQSVSQVFSLKGVEFVSESNLSLVLLTMLRKGVLSGQLEDSDDRIYLVPGSLKKDEVSLKVTVPDGVEDTNEIVRAMIHRVLKYLKEHSSGFRNVELVALATALGVRTASRPSGKYILSGKDVLEGVKPDTTIAYGNWPMEIWGESKRVELKRFEEGDHYGIPAESLMSNEVSNLFFAGRCISADDEGIASARVIGTCLQTGYAAGYLAGANADQKDVHQAIEEIQTLEFG